LLDLYTQPSRASCNAYSLIACVVSNCNSQRRERGLHSAHNISASISLYPFGCCCQIHFTVTVTRFFLPDVSIPYHFHASQATIHKQRPQTISKKISFEIWYFWEAAGPKSHVCLRKLLGVIVELVRKSLTSNLYRYPGTQIWRGGVKLKVKGLKDEELERMRGKRRSGSI
jgi:hypothetical protein